MVLETSASAININTALSYYTHHTHRYYLQRHKCDAYSGSSSLLVTEKFVQYPRLLGCRKQQAVVPRPNDTRNDMVLSNYE